MPHSSRNLSVCVDILPSHLPTIAEERGSHDYTASLPELSLSDTKNPLQEESFRWREQGVPSRERTQLREAKLLHWRTRGNPNAMINPKLLASHNTEPNFEDAMSSTKCKSVTISQTCSKDEKESLCLHDNIADFGSCSNNPPRTIAMLCKERTLRKLPLVLDKPRTAPENIARSCTPSDNRQSSLRSDNALRCSLLGIRQANHVPNDSMKDQHIRLLKQRSQRLYESSNVFMRQVEDIKHTSAKRPLHKSSEGVLPLARRASEALLLNQTKVEKYRLFFSTKSNKSLLKHAQRPLQQHTAIP